MLCKVTSKNQITLPKELIDSLKISEYLDARIENGCIVLEPMIVRPLVGRRLQEIRRKIGERNLREEEVSGIVDEVRRAGRL